MGTLFFLKKDTCDFPPDQKVIKAEDYLMCVEANNLIETAREQARSIIAEAKEAYEAEKKRGYEAGIEQGKGVMAERMITTVRETVEYFASVEETLCTLVITALRKIVGEMDDKELIMRIVRNALAPVRAQKQVTLRVSPADHETVQHRIHEIIKDFPGIGFIDVVLDNRLKEDGCIVESEIGVIDASLDVQIEAIRRSLLKCIKR